MPSFSGTITETSPSVTYQIRLARGKHYIIDVRGVGGEVGLPDPILSVIGENGQFGEDDNGGIGRNAQLAFRPDKTQYYEFTISGNAGSTGDFALDVNIDDFRDGRIGSAPAGEAPADGQQRMGRINYDGDADVFAVNLVAGLTYSFRMLRGPAGTDRIDDPLLTLLPARGPAIVADDDSGAADDAFISFKARETGEYWLRAQGSDGEAGTYFVLAGVGKGSPSADTLRGGDGADVLNAMGGDDDVLGGAGNDRIWGASGKDTLDGQDGADRILGGLHADILRGGLGADDVLGEEGRDSLDGGEGNDSVFGGDGKDVAAGGAGGDFVTGDIGNDRLNGDDGNDSLSGGDGDDSASGGAGSDSVSGDSGDDRLDGGEEADSIDGGEGHDHASGGFDDDFVSGGSGEDRLHGDDGDDFVDGWSDNDLVFGGEGNDNLNGEEGDDLLNGGEDGDFYWGGDGNDVLRFTSISHSLLIDPDEIGRFDRPGATEGDLIDLSRIDADRTVPGSQTLAFGVGQGKGSVWLQNDTAPNSTATLLYLNVDNDADPELLVKIFDGRGVRSDDYVADDFVL